jgi:hypothetical protein
MSGANSLLETGNMGFGTRAVLAFRFPIASFPFQEKEAFCFLGRFFEARHPATRLDFEFTELEFTEQESE